MAKLNFTVGPSLLLVPVALYVGYKVWQGAKVAGQAAQTAQPYVNYGHWSFNPGTNIGLTVGDWIGEWFKDDPSN